MHVWLTAFSIGLIPWKYCAAVFLAAAQSAYVGLTQNKSQCTWLVVMKPNHGSQYTGEAYWWSWDESLINQALDSKKQTSWDIFILLNIWVQQKKWKWLMKWLKSWMAWNKWPNMKSSLQGYTKFLPFNPTKNQGKQFYKAMIVSQDVGTVKYNKHHPDLLPSLRQLKSTIPNLLLQKLHQHIKWCGFYCRRIWAPKTILSMGLKTKSDVFLNGFIDRLLYRFYNKCLMLIFI